LVIAALCTPLVTVLAILGLYNFLRFDSFFEFGLQYSLAGTYNHQVFRDNLITSINYIIPSFYNYVLLPFGGLAIRNPFLVLANANNPGYQGPTITFEFMVGFIWSAPFTIFSIFPIFSAVRFWLYSKRPIANNPQCIVVPRKSAQTWIPILLGGGALFGICPLLVYFFGAMRYQLDFLPLLTLLSIYGLGTAWNDFSDRPKIKQLLVTSAFFLAFITILVGFWLGINSSFFQYCQYVPSLVCKF
jgi:hypothetical protein